MQINSLPANTTPEMLRERAESLLKAAKSNDHKALERIGPYFGDPSRISLQTAQLVLAREFSFSSWNKLNRHLEQRTSDENLTHDQLANQFLDLVIVQYTPVADLGPVRFEQAAALLDEHPEILSENIYAAAAVGDTELVDHWLEKDSGLLNQKGGFHQWEPLMYATYARLPGRSTLATALRLLERGADPNAYYMSNGQYKFTALTGAFGQGERGIVNQPEHPDYLPLCRALLQHGANANDSQAAYNRSLGTDNICLRMLLEFGLNAGDKSNWLISGEDQWLPNLNETMHYHLIQSIRRGLFDRAKLLIDNGVDIHKPDDTYETRTKGKSPLETALIAGEREIADYLRANGADDSDVPTLTLLQAACSTGDAVEAEKLLRSEPTLRQAVIPYEREMLCEAVNKGNLKALDLMCKLEFNLNDNTGRPPLHDAALAGNLDVVKFLIEVGADPTLRDPDHLAPPIGFAQYAKHDHVVEFLDTLQMDIVTAAARGKLVQLRLRLEEDPTRLNITFKQIRPTLKKQYSENDWMTPLVFAALNNRLEAVEYLLAQNADPEVNNGSAMNLPELLEKNNAGEEMKGLIQTALENRSPR